jgi:PEP-CTERM motif
MKNSIKYLAVLAVLCASLQTQAAVQTYNFDGVMDSGVYLGESFNGTFSFDDATIDNIGFDLASLLSFDMTFLSTNFSLTNVAGTPDVSFQDGSFLGLALNINSSIPDVGFTFVPGYLDTSDAYIAYESNLGFDGAGNVNYAIAAPVPEPESYGMLLAGLGLIGLASRRKLI